MSIEKILTQFDKSFERIKQPEFFDKIELNQSNSTSNIHVRDFAEYMDEGQSGSLTVGLVALPEELIFNASFYVYNATESDPEMARVMSIDCEFRTTPETVMKVSRKFFNRVVKWIDNLHFGCLGIFENKEMTEYYQLEEAYTKIMRQATDELKGWLASQETIEPTEEETSETVETEKE